ncbi:MAG: serine hydrolase [Bacteroidetes bacterium]|nr:serine hydrolase [Bacteroidota bacterium]
MKNLKITFIFFIIICFASDLFAQPITISQVDTVVERAMKTFNVPGIAVAIVKDGKTLLEKGYGVTSLNTMQKMNEHTRFGIASNSKAFTTASLGILVDEGKLKWNDRVTDYIPGFKLYAPYVTENFTIRDLITHRSGMGLGAGDLMIWPDSSTFTLTDIIHNLRYLKQVSDFRTKYDYDNLLYIVAGEVVARVSGMSWEKFVQTKIMDPLQMTESAPNYELLKDKNNVIDPHAPVNGKVQVIHRDWKYVADAAGGIYSSVHDMCKWVTMQMNDGKYGDDLTKQLLEKSTHEEMWTPQTIIPVLGPTPYNTHFASYGLGWFLSDEMGYKVATHTGGLAGIVTQVTLIPEMKLGIIVFTNQQSGAAFRSITNTIKDSYYGIKGKDWVKQYKELVDKSVSDAKAITDKIWHDIDAAQLKNTASVDFSKYTGTYTDPWFGDVVISEKNGKPWFDSKNSPRLTGEMVYYKGNTFIVKWDDRSMDADAYVMFTLDYQGNPDGIKMKPISPLTDFSFDFQDLDFARKK